MLHPLEPLQKTWPWKILTQLPVRVFLVALQEARMGLPAKAAPMVKTIPLSLAPRLKDGQAPGRTEFAAERVPPRTAESRWLHMRTHARG